MAVLLALILSLLAAGPVVAQEQGASGERSHAPGQEWKWSLNGVVFFGFNDQHQRLTVTMYFVIHLYVIDFYVRHGCSISRLIG